AVRDHLLGKKGEDMTAGQVARETGFSDKAGWVFKILENLTVNQPESFERVPGENPLETGFRAL
ncbi:MAG: hypothetical protein HN531_07030, partial [Opitutae bacterium]|nr:hypothetical protein [Opitutae bacterium]